jgi:hypothetical protein
VGQQWHVGSVGNRGHGTELAAAYRHTAGSLMHAQAHGAVQGGCWLAVEAGRVEPAFSCGHYERRTDIVGSWGRSVARGSTAWRSAQWRRAGGVGSGFCLMAQLNIPHWRMGQRGVAWQGVAWRGVV